MRRRGKGGSLAPNNQMLQVDGAHQLGKTAHLGEEKLWLKTSTALWQYPVMKKASRVNLKEKSKSEPLRQLDIDLNFILAVPVTLLVPNCSSPAGPLDPSAGWRGGTGCMGNSLSPITQCPGLYLPMPSTIHSQPHLERTIQLCHLCGVDSTQKATDTSYKPSLNWCRVQCQGLLPMVGEIFVSHWTATTCLKLAAPSQ